MHEYRKKGRGRHAGRWGLHRHRPVGKTAGSTVRVTGRQVKLVHR